MGVRSAAPVFGSPQNTSGTVCRLSHYSDQTAGRTCFISGHEWETSNAATPPPHWLPHTPDGSKRPGLEADHSPPSNTQFKNIWSPNSTRTYAF